MSNIYIQEPPTSGKVLLITTVGDIDIELWSKETPKACRNFLQLAMEGYYNGTTFHRIVKGFIAQGGDPTGTGSGGESIYGHPFKDEFHSRLRFCRRGLVAMANSGKDDNGSQFFFTFAACPELQNKHTIFGKVTGETLYNMIKLEEAVTDDNETPLYPQKIIKAEILNNPFPDIVPRSLPQKKIKRKRDEKVAVGVKNFKLLSFGEEAEEEEEENTKVTLTFAGKSKSTHDVLNDPKLSSCSALEIDNYNEIKEEDSYTESTSLKIDSITESIKEKLKKGKSKLKENRTEKVKVEEESDLNYDNNDLQEKNEKQKRLEEISKEIKALKKEYQKNRKFPEKNSQAKESKKSSSINVTDAKRNEMVEEFKNNLEKYKILKNNIPKKGISRENMTLELLAGFKERLQAIKEKAEEVETKNDSDDKEEIEENKSWLAHKLNFEGNNPVLAKDANLKSDDWFDITDPRNPINKRRREINKSNKTRP